MIRRLAPIWRRLKLNWLVFRLPAHQLSAAALMGWACLLSGCQEAPAPDPRQPIEGVVLVENTPLDRGVVTLVPIEGTRGPRVTAVVVQGKFQLSSDMGPWPGKYRVEVNTTPPELRAMVEGRQRSEISAREQREFRDVHPDYNSKSRVTVQVLRQQENKYRIQTRWEERPRAEAEVNDSSAVLNQYVGVAEHRRPRITDNWHHVCNCFCEGSYP